MNSVDQVWRLDGQLHVFRPDAIAVLNTLNVLAWQVISPVLLEQVRLRVGALIGNSAGLLRRSSTAREQGLSEAKLGQLAEYYKSGAYTPFEKQALSFAEQMVIDVTGLTAVDVTALAQYVPPDKQHEFVSAMYITECTQRLELMVPMLLGSSSEPQPMTVNPSDVSAGLVATLERYQETVVRGTALDPVTTEMVRLRCARTHNCRICKTLRLTDSRAAGVDDTMTAKIDFYERSDLDERIKIALRITDAFITRPDTLGQAVIEQARAAFTPEALVEMCLDITKWSVQKIYVSLGSDAADFLPKNAQGTSFFSFDKDGRVAGFEAN